MSSIFFNDLEAARIAVNMERNGQAFYTRAAKQTKNPDVRRMFDELAEAEKEHLAYFERWQQQLAAQPRSPVAPPAEDDETAAYIARLAESHVFADSSSIGRLLAEATNDIAALALGNPAERDTILFYQEMSDFTDSQVVREAFKGLIEEECRHLKLLADRSEHCETLRG